MFKKESCKRCGEKLDKESRFCSNCGTSLNRNSNENWGMLGKHDETNELEQFSRNIFEGFGGGMLGKMFEGAMKMLEKEMKREMRDIKSNPNADIRLFINGKRINLNKNNEITQRPKKQIRKIELPGKALKNFSMLPKEEPKTSMRRFSDRVVYEIEIPGVISMNNLSIVPLENSIEIKATSKNKAYFKIIPINLPIINYSLERENLILEFGV